MKIVLLPGLDGTGELFAPFISRLPRELTHQVITYPVDREMGYDELVDYVLARLPVNEPFILLGESFSGPIAYQVALHNPAGLQAVVFVATFLNNPRPVLLSLLCLLPLKWLLRIPLAAFILRWFFLGGSSGNELLQQVRHVVRQVSPSVLALRLREISRISLPEEPLEMSVIYIQASEDRLVLVDSLNRFSALCAKFKHQLVNGPHAILQVNPVDCVAVLKEVFKANE